MKRATQVKTERRIQPRVPDGRWRTALTCIEPNKILIRGYPLDEMMGRLTFGESIYLLLMGEVPSPGIGSLIEAMLVSFIDHGATPPSTLAARNTATTGAPLRACVAAGVLGFGRYHGGDIESCMQFLDSGLSLVREGTSYQDAAAGDRRRDASRHGEPIPGFGHRFHTRDPRAARLFQMALELELEGGARPDDPRGRSARSRAREDGEPPLPVNIDGAIAAVCGDLGIPPEVAQRALHHLARAGHHRARARRTRAPDSRCARSIRRTTATTARRSGGCLRDGNDPDCGGACRLAVDVGAVRIALARDLLKMSTRIAPLDLVTIATRLLET